MRCFLSFNFRRYLFPIYSLFYNTFILPLPTSLKTNRIMDTMIERKQQTSFRLRNGFAPRPGMNIAA